MSADPAWTRPDVPGMTMINPIVVTGDVNEFTEVIDAMMKYMSSQPGFLRLRLHRSYARPLAYCMVAEWEDLESHQRAADAMTDEARTVLNRLRGLVDAAPDFFATVEVIDVAGATSP
jgi:heme-degrading monooxygenase HmoA